MRRSVTPFLILLSASIPLLASARLSQRTALDDALDRAALYVMAFEKECSAVVAEEHYTQDLKAGCRRAAGGAIGDANPADDKRFWDTGATGAREKAPDGPAHRELVSDVLMVQLPDQTWVGFRDVVKVDGRPVRDRVERLQSLFLRSQASLRKVQDESARYNIGHIQTTMNLPTFALAYLHPSLRDRFAFEKAPDESVDGKRVIVVSFTERQHPTVISNGRGKDIVSTGRFWIDPSAGTVVRSLLIAGDGTSDARVESAVTFARHAEWGLFLPSEMSEMYDVPSRPDGFCVIGSATYSNFRRFQVTTDEQIKVPKHE